MLICPMLNLPMPTPTVSVQQTRSFMNANYGPYSDLQVPLLPVIQKIRVGANSERIGIEHIETEDVRFCCSSCFPVAHTSS
jgi:hypothetical protein